MDDTRIKTAARKALMAADPLYHSWPSDRQEQFRATMGEAARDKVAAVLLGELLDIACTPENAGDIWRDLPLSKLNDLNWAKLLTTGMGEDMIFLNESMADNTSLLDFDTLHDYDFDNHLFQEAVNKKEFKDYPGRDYYALRFLLWARLIVDGQLHYANLYSLAGYLVMQLEERGRDIIQALIPHDYVEGKNHGKREKGGFLWDMQLDANGLEEQLKALQLRWHDHIQQRWTELSRSFVHDAPMVFMYDTNQDGESHRNFIFNNEAALKRIRWRHFLSDCEQLKADFSEVARQEQQELEKADIWLQETHRDIMLNFDPTVAVLRKKRKVIVTPGAFDNLTEPDDDGSE